MARPVGIGSMGVPAVTVQMVEVVVQAGRMSSPPDKEAALAVAVAVDTITDTAACRALGRWS